MSRRFPNEPHWQRAVDCAQRVCGTKGRAWRRGLALHLGIEQRDLRATIDRPMDPVEQRDLDDKLAAFLRHYADIAYARCQRLDAHLCRLVESRDAREADRLRALDEDAEWEWEEMFPEFFATLRIVNTHKEAA